MKIYFLFLLFCALLNGYELRENYEYNQSILYSTDLFPNLDKKFEILQIPQEKTNFRIDSQILAKTFELHGITVDTSKARFVNFTKSSPLDFSPFKKQLRSHLQERYPDINIEEIVITPRGYLTGIAPNTKAVFDDHFYLNSKGTFYVLDSAGLRRYLDYTVFASLGVLHTTQPISRRDKLTGFNTLLKPVKFDSFKDTPLTTLPDQISRFRSNLKPNQLLTVRNIEVIPLVLKNEKVIVEVKNESVIVEFGATATQEGSLYDIITIQKSDGKRVKAKVIGENRVELQ